MTMPLQRWFVIRRLGLYMISLSTKFEVSAFTHYEDMKGNTKCRNGVGFGRLGVTQGHWKLNHSIEYIQFLFDFNRNYMSILYCFRVITSYFSKDVNFKLLHLHLAPPLGLTPFKFRQDLWHQKTRVPGLTCGFVA